MLKPRKKSTFQTKKDIKEDKFVGGVLEAKAYIEDNYKKVSGIVFAIIAFVLIIMGYSYVKSQANVEATTLFGKAQVEYQNFNYGKARSFLLELRDHYGDTEQGQQGILFLANLHFQDDQIDAAKELYQEFVDSYGGSEILLSSGYAGLAACFETEGNHSAAAEHYLKAQKVAPDFVEAANYLYLAGRNFIRAGEISSAQSAFKNIVENYESSNRKFDAESQLILLAKN
jgi:outer membrane protein assembly factor BamD (BamD/ComL family)